MDKEQADAVDQEFNLDYDVAQAFCSHIVPKAVLLFTGEVLDDVMEFEPEDGEEDDNNYEGINDEGGGGVGLPFLASANTTGEC